MILLSLNLDYQGESLEAYLVGKLTRKEVYQLESYLIPYIQKHNIRFFHCHCKYLKKMDAEGRYALLKTKIILHQQKGQLFLYDVNAKIKKDFIGYRMRILN